MKKETILAAGVTLVVIISLIIILRKKKAPAAPVTTAPTIKPVLAPAVNPGIGAAIGQAFNSFKENILPSATAAPVTEIARLNITERTLQVGAVNSAGAVIGYSGQITVRPDGDDIARACFHLWYHLPIENTVVGYNDSPAARALFKSGGNTDKSTLSNLLNNCAVIGNTDVGTSVNPIDDRSYSAGLDGFVDDVFTMMQNDFTANPANMTATAFSHDNPAGLPVFNWIKNGDATALTTDLTVNYDLPFLFQSLVNEYLPQIKSNLSRLTSNLDITLLSGMINNLTPTLQTLNTGTPTAGTQWTEAADQLILIDRWIRQKLVFQTVVNYGNNLTGSPADWGRIITQILYDIAIPGSIASANTNAAPDIMAYFNDRQAIQILNYIQPVLAPTQAQINSQAAAAAAAAQQNEAAILNIAKIAISIALAF